MDHNTKASLARPRLGYEVSSDTAPSSPTKLQIFAPSSSFSSLSWSPSNGGALCRPQSGTTTTASDSDDDLQSDVKYQFTASLSSLESSTPQMEIGKQPSLPLEFPPRLQSLLTYGPAPAMAKRRGGKHELSGLISFKRKEFDPFTAALKQIREDKPWYKRWFLFCKGGRFKDSEERSTTQRSRQQDLLACFGFKA